MRLRGLKRNACGEFWSGLPRVREGGCYLVFMRASKMAIRAETCS